LMESYSHLIQRAAMEASLLKVSASIILHV
jgi:hypothetical protein